MVKGDIFPFNEKGMDEKIADWEDRSVKDFSSLENHLFATLQKVRNQRDEWKAKCVEVQGLTPEEIELIEGAVSVTLDLLTSPDVLKASQLPRMDTANEATRSQLRGIIHKLEARQDTLG